MPTRAQLAAIHIAAKQLGLTDEIYRDILYTRYGKDSARDLSQEEVSSLLAYFHSLGWQPRARTSREWPGMASVAQRRKIYATWMTSPGILFKNADALRHFLQHRFHVADLDHVRADQVSAILGALRHINAPPPANAH